MAEQSPDTQAQAVGHGQRQLEVVAYIGDFKIIGFAHFGVAQRSTSRRASDYIRQFNDNRLTLSKVRIYSRTTQELLEAAPFVIVNMDKIDFIYARDDEPAGS
jgi:hypothetical protein